MRAVYSPSPDLDTHMIYCSISTLGQPAGSMSLSLVTQVWSRALAGLAPPDPHPEKLNVLLHVGARVMHMKRTSQKMQASCWGTALLVSEHLYSLKSLESWLGSMLPTPFLGSIRCLTSDVVWQAPGAAASAALGTIFWQKARARR